MELHYDEKLSQASPAARPGELFYAETIRPGLIRITCPGMVYCYLVTGEKKAILIDTAFGYGDLRSFVQSLTDLPVEVILTHGHLDHCGGAEQFETVYMNPADLSVAKVHGSVKERQGGLKSFKLPYDEENMIPDVRPERLLPLEAGQVFDLGGISLEMVPIPGHTRGAMGILFRELRLFLGGDALCNMTLLSFDHAASVEEYLDGLKDLRVKYWDCFDDMIYSHSHNTGSKEVLDQMIGLCTDILAGRFGEEELQSAGKPTRVQIPVDGVNNNAIHLIYSRKFPDVI